MIEIVEIKEKIRSKLLECGKSVYYKQAPANQGVPYLVFNLPNSFPTSEHTVVHMLEIDGWDKGPSTFGLDQLFNDVDSKLRGLVIDTDKYTLIVSPVNRLDLGDDDKTIGRQKWTYNIKSIARR